VSRMSNEIRWQKCLRCDAAEYQDCDCPGETYEQCKYNFADGTDRCTWKKKVCTAVICHHPTQVCVDINELGGPNNAA